MATLQTTQLQAKKMENPSNTSPDGPPLDFSFKNIRLLMELKTMEPRSGVRKPIPIDEEDTQKEETKPKEDEKESNKNEDEKSQKEEEGETKEGDENEQKTKEKKEEKKSTGPVIIRAIPNYQQTGLTGTQNIVSIGGQTKTNPGTLVQDVQAKQNKKQFKVKLECKTLIIGYNKIRELKDFPMIISFVMHDFSKLQWIDLSHNYLTRLDYDFRDTPDLKFLYLHCNYLRDLNDLMQLQHLPLRALTIHGNPLETIQNFRLYLIGMLAHLKKLDSVLISKKERDNCNVWMNQFNFQKAPLPKENNITQPPEESNTQSNPNEVGKINQ